MSDADKQAVYEAALEIVGAVGQRVHHPGAREMLLGAGCGVTEPDLEQVPRELVEQAPATAPRVIEVFDRGGRQAMSLGGYNTYFGNGSAVTGVYDLESGDHRPSVRPAAPRRLASATRSRTSTS